MRQAKRDGVRLLPYNRTLLWGVTNWTIANISKDGGVSGQHLEAGGALWMQR